MLQLKYTAPLIILLIAAQCRSTPVCERVKAPEGMSCIPAGEYSIGSDNSDWADERPQHRVKLSAFFIDRNEVSVAEYKKCVDKGRCSPVVSNYRHMRSAELPQLKVSWYEARTYCRVQGKRLPTEAEFEAATRGPQADIYSWGNSEPDCSKTVFKAGDLRGCTDKHRPTGSVAAVGSRPAGKFGLYDMTGNAHEWVSDWYLPYRECGEACRGTDPQGPCAGQKECAQSDKKVVKGGSWYWNADWARAAKRRAHFPENEPTHHFGFRCAKDAPAAE